MSDIEERIEEHCKNGGFYNPEPMQHEKVRALLIDCLEEIKLLRGYRDEAEADAALARLLLDKSRLTDAEREAVDRQAKWLFNQAKNKPDIHSADLLLQEAATLRGLLERLG